MRKKYYEDLMNRNLDRLGVFTRELIRNPDKYPDDFVAIPLDDDLVPSILSPERIRLIRRLRDHGPYKSVSALARSLKRDQGRVSRDLSYLAGSGLVIVERKGKRKIVRAPKKPILLV